MKKDEKTLDYADDVIHGMWPLESIRGIDPGFRWGKAEKGVAQPALPLF